MPYLTTMLDVTKLYLFLFGVLTVGGGVMGFVKAGSKASLLAGGISGVLLLVAGYLIGSDKVKPGLILGIVVSLALAGRFIPAYLNTQKVMPAGLMAGLSILGLVLTVLALIKK